MSKIALSDEQRLDWLALLNSENVGPVTFFKLINRFGDAETAIRALPELSGRGGLKRSIKLCSRDKAQKLMHGVEQIGARLIAICEPEYPSLLAQIDGAPPLICAKGRVDLLNQTCVAIVGSRNASAVGLNFARMLAGELGANGYVSVSGLARGIDTAVHEASIETGTIAVVAGGIDVIYPPENGALHGEVFDRGIVISEMMPTIRPQARHFPRRNRIISGLAAGTVVVEAALRSGSLITARLANEQNREVFAVPGSPLDPRAGGTNKLIKDGATLVTNALDVINTMADYENRQIKQVSQGDFFAEDEAAIPLDFSESEPEQDVRSRIIALMSPSPTATDALVRESGGDVAMVHAVLLELELAGRLERHTGQRVSLI